MSKTNIDRIIIRRAKNGVVIESELKALKPWVRDIMRMSDTDILSEAMSVANGTSRLSSAKREFVVHIGSLISGYTRHRAALDVEKKEVDNEKNNSV